MGTESGAIMQGEPAPAPSAGRERRLVREAKRGSREALTELYASHWRRAHRAAYLVVHDSAAAEDIAQDAFLAAIDALDRFDRRRPFGRTHLRPDSSILPSRRTRLEERLDRTTPPAHRTVGAPARRAARGAHETQSIGSSDTESPRVGTRGASGATRITTSPARALGTE